MNILNKLSIKNLKLNKKRTISTVIGIILSVALICAVSSMFKSFQETLVKNAVNEAGYYHLRLFDINDDNINELKNNRDIKTINIVDKIGYSLLENSQNAYKPYLQLSSMSQDTFNNLSFKLEEGYFPKDSNEIVISKHISSNAKVNYKIGDKIKLNVGSRRTLDGYKLQPSNLYNKEDEGLFDTKEYEFTIVGIIERPDNSFEALTNPGYTIITTGISSYTKDSYIALKKPMDYKISIAEILGANVKNNEILLDSSDLKYESFKINQELLRWEVFAFSDSTVSMLYAVCGVVILIIIFTSVFCIRNSFAIATNEKIKMYGMLASIGATKKQIRKNVIFEALLLGIVAIPLGIVLGIIAVFILIKIVNAILGEYLFGNVDGIIFSISFIPILLSIILGFITIYLSAISSARRASKVSPIESLRNTNEIKIKGKTLKTPKIITRLFKTGGTLAYKNLKRSKKKYRTTVISLTVSIFIFITMNSFVTNMFNFTGNYYTDYDYNVKITDAKVDLTDDMKQKIISLSNVDESFILYEEMENYVKVFDINKINQIDCIDLIEDSYYDEESEENIITGKGKYSGLAIIALDDESFKKYVKKIGKDPEKVKQAGILCDNYLYYDETNNKEKEIRRYKYLENEYINAEYNNKPFSIKVGAVTDIRPYGKERNYYDGGYLVVNFDEFKDANFYISEINIQSSNPGALEQEIKNMNYDVGFINFDETVKQERSMILVINIFLYGFIAVITLIGVTNIFNTISSNMDLRQKEFAMLKSIGMTKKEFNRMINLETIFYSVKALFYGIILGLFGTFMIYKSFAIKLDSKMYIPVNPIIISIVFVFILVFIIMKYSINKINKQNTIETIRNDNI